jgi:hypothetical protein
MNKKLQTHAGMSEMMTDDVNPNKGFLRIVQPSPDECG